jgi:hypothetical protein
MYMGCAKRNSKPDVECKQDFNSCSMVAMGMTPPPPAETSYPDPTTTTTTIRPIEDIDLAQLPDFLKPQSTTKRPLRPIQDIDLPENQEMIVQGSGADSGAGNGGNGASNGGNDAGNGGNGVAVGDVDAAVVVGDGLDVDAGAIADLFTGSDIHNDLVINHPEGEQGSNGNF